MMALAVKERNMVYRMDALPLQASTRSVNFLAIWITS